MAATGLASASSTFSGLRPIDLRRDLAQVADLIEFCFAPTLDSAGRSAIQEMRAISRFGPLVWALGRLSSVVPGLMRGFVWVEQGRLVGNVSVSPAGYGRGWLIANVAVHPDCRRRGIARRLMGAAMDLVAQRGAFAALQVEADNTGARALYESLGFHEMRTFTRWRRSTHHGMSPTLPKAFPLRRLAPRDANRLMALAEQVRPNSQGGIGWLRPLDQRQFRPKRWGVLRYLIGGQRVAYWGVPGEDSTLDAALAIETRIGVLSMIFDLLVRPERRGELEGPLIDALISRLGGRFSPLVTEHPADDEAARDVFLRHYFRPERTLTHMFWPVPKT